MVMNGYSQKEAKREGEGLLWIGAHQEFQWLETEGPLCTTSPARGGYCMGEKRLSWLVSAAMINTKTENNLERKGFISAYSLSKECCLLACSPWIAQRVFL